MAFYVFNWTRSFLIFLSFDGSPMVLQWRTAKALKHLSSPSAEARQLTTLINSALVPSLGSRFIDSVRRTPELLMRVYKQRLIRVGF